MLFDIEGMDSPREHLVGPAEQHLGVHSHIKHIERNDLLGPRTFQQPGQAQGLGELGDHRHASNRFTNLQGGLERCRIIIKADKDGRWKRIQRKIRGGERRNADVDGN